MKSRSFSIKPGIKLKIIASNVVIFIIIGLFLVKIKTYFQNEKSGNYILLAIIALLLTISFLIFYLSVIRPLKKIIAETEYLGRGDLNHILELDKFPSEIKPLAKNLNKMAQTFESDSGTLKNRINELTTIYKLNSEIAITLNLNEVMDTAKRVLKSIIDFSKILIYVKDFKSGNYQLASGINLSLADPLELDKNSEVIQLAFMLNDAVVLNQFPEMRKTAQKNENWEILSPMIVNKEQVGIIKIEIDEGKSVDEDIVRLIKTLTTQIGIGIQNANLYSELEQKVADQTLELRKSYEIIFSQKEELQTIIHSIGDPLVVTDEENRIEMVNDAFKRVFDLFSKDYHGLPIHGLFSVKSLTDFYFQNLSQNDTIFIKEIVIDDMKELFSEPKYFLVSSALIIRENSKKRYVTIFRDITEQKKLDKMKSDFVSTVSHELRTPLTSIKAFAKILISNTDQSIKEREEFLNIIDTEADRLTRLINDILDLSKLEAGKLDFDFKSLDIVETIRMQVKNLYSIIKQAGVKITMRRQNVPLVIADRDRITQVITNLLSNSSKFTDEKGSISITVKKVTLNQLVQSHVDQETIKERYPLIDQTHSYVEVSVKDTGIGISKENLVKIFDKFKQIGDTLTDKPKGTGLGLPICKQIMESHNGNIWAESEIKKGSTFYFSLPIYTKIQEKKINKKSSLSSKRILVIDKNEEYRKTLLIQLKRFNVFQAENIASALDQIDKYKGEFDLIIIDPRGLDYENLFYQMEVKKIKIPLIVNTSDASIKIPKVRQKVFKSPPDNILLIKKVNHFFETEKDKVLLTVKNELLAYSLSVYLTQNNYDLYLAANASDTLKKSFGINPDMLIISDTHDDVPPLEFFHELRRHEITKDVMCIFIKEKEATDTSKLKDYNVDVIEKERGVEYIVSRINEHFLKYNDIIS